jgi:DNA polymerase-3 subunit delta'
MHDFWDKIVAQEKAKQQLNNICISRRVPHAFLFYGHEGIGKYFTALQFTKKLNLEFNPNLSENVIQKISNLQEPYIKLIFPLPRGKGETGEDSATEKLSKDVIELILEEMQKKISNPYHKINVADANNIKINSIRDIKKFVNISYDDTHFRFIIILDAHQMNETAQNALLKNLEEPPDRIIFILISSNKDNLLPTIQSRCWQINFEPLSNKDVGIILHQFYKVEDTTIEKLILFSHGSPLNSIEFIDKDIDELLKSTISFLRYALGKKYHLAYKTIQSLLNEGNTIKIVILLIKSWLNDVVRNKYSLTQKYFNEYKDTIMRYNSKFKQEDTLELLAYLEKIEKHLENNPNLNIVYLCLIFDIASIAIRN